MPARIEPGELALTAALLAVYYSSRTSAKVLGVMHGALQR